MAAVGAGDDGTRARVDDTLEEGMTLTHDVVSRVFVKERGEHGLPEEALRGGAYGGRTQSLAKGARIRSIVGAAVPQLLPSRGREPTGRRGGGERVFEAAYNLVMD